MSVKGVNEISQDVIRTVKYRKIQEVKLRFYARKWRYLYVCVVLDLAMSENMVLESYVHVS